MFVLKTGCQWPAIPKDYGVHYSTCWRRLKRWEENGTWQRIIEALLGRTGSSSVRYLGCEGKKRGACVGQTHGGKTTKRSIITESHGWPVCALLFSGNCSDFKTALPTVEKLSIRPQRLAADRGYDAQWLRNALRQWHIQSAIARKNSASGKKRRKLTQSAKAIFKNRWKVERGFAWLDGFRRLVMR